MTNAAFDKLKERFKKKSEQKSEQKKTGKNFNTEIYPFWTMEFDQSCLIRILADANENNEDAFFIEKFEHKLSVNGKDRSVICIQRHYGEKCPICELSQKFYKSKDDKQGLYYYINRRYYLRALVLTDPLPADEETKENSVGKVKLFRMNSDLHGKIMTEIAEKLENPPWDFKNGYDFKIKKMKGSGGHPDYIMGSGFEWKPTSIPKELYSTFDPNNLSDNIPANPGVEFVTHLLNSHLTGEPEDGEKKKSEEKSVSGSTPVSTLAELPTHESAATETVDDTEKDAAPDEDDAIFKAILARRNAKKTG